MQYNDNSGVSTKLSLASLVLQGWPGGKEGWVLCKASRMKEEEEEEEKENVTIGIERNVKKIDALRCVLRGFG